MRRSERSERWAAIGAVWGGYDGYKYAKRKRLHGWRKAGAIVGGAVLGVVNPFRRAGKAFKAARRVSRFVRKSRIAKGVSRCLRKTFRRTRIRRHIRRYAIKTVHAAKRVRCRVTRKGCFAAGTPIAVKNGFVPIEKIKAGDRVWSEDTRTGEKGLKKVKKIFVREKDSIVRLSINGEVTEATEEHPFFVKDIGWIPAGELNVGDLVKLQSGEFVPVEGYEVVQLDEPIKVYNFVVEDFHTYYVSEQKVLVHNNGCGTGRSKNKIRPNPRAKGSHSVFKRDNSGRVTNYRTYRVNKKHPDGFSEEKGYDSNHGHVNKATGKKLKPHVHDKKAKGGVRKPRKDEIPR